MLDKEEILHRSREAFHSVAEICQPIPQEKFFDHPPGKWSIAENIRHLIISTNASALAFRAPGIILRWWAGRPNRASRSYEELVARYQLKLSQGGKAKGRFIPKNVSRETAPREWIKKWVSSTDRYLKVVDKNITEEQLDEYLIKHPLLGRITLRELCYFTIYHTQHHLRIIKDRVST